jgi:hypothetical protein
MGASAQQTAYVTKHGNDVSGNQTTAKPTINLEKAVSVWSDDFSTPANWSVAQSGAESVEWTIETTEAAMPNAAATLYPFASASLANGYALINSDGAPGNADGNGNIASTITSTTTIDLSTTPNAILKFNHNYRWWQESRGVRVSGDGGSTWTDFDLTYTVASGNTFPNGNQYPDVQNSLNPQEEVINISAVAGGSSNVVIEFYYDDGDFWGWYWAVDDVEILTQPLDDIQVLSAWFSGATNDGSEYGRTPIDQVDTDYILGAEVYNFGVNDQTNIAIAADYNGSAITSASAAALIQSDSTELIEATETPSLSVGMYNGTYTAVSDNETGGSDFGNNVYERNFEITDDIYSVDGLGNQPASTLDVGVIGTGSFTDAEDGLVVAALYQFKSASDVSGIRVILDAGTVEGGEIYGSIKDTTTFWANDMTSLFNSSVATVSATDIAAGYIDVWFPSVINLNAGVYYAAVELYSNAGANDIVIVDDRTVAQPARTSSIYIPGDQSYTNGTGIGVQLLTGNGWGVGIEENTLDGVSIYPNPSEGIVNVSNDNNMTNTIVVYDMVGSVVLSTEASAATTLDLSGNGTGIYVVEVSNNNGTMVERVVIK